MRCLPALLIYPLLFSIHIHIHIPVEYAQFRSFSCVMSHNVCVRRARTMCSVARHEPRAQRDSYAAHLDRTAAQPAEARPALQSAERSARLSLELHTATPRESQL